MDLMPLLELQKKAAPFAGCSLLALRRESLKSLSSSRAEEQIHLEGCNWALIPWGERN
jgi:hypothetical protein